MKLLVLTLCLMFGGVVSIHAETYRWNDEQGVIHFTDSPESIPKKYRNQVKTGEDITIRNPKVQEDLKQQEQRARDDAARPRIYPTPDYVPAQQPLPQVVVPSGSASDELPPGRTKSQRIQDNINRREAEEAGKNPSGRSGY